MTLGAWCGASALPGLWIAASLAAGLHALALLAAARVPLGALWRPGLLWRGGQATFVVGERRGAPYAAFLVIAAGVWFVCQHMAGAVR